MKIRKGRIWRFFPRVKGCTEIGYRNGSMTSRVGVDYRQTATAGAVTGRQRESIPAGTGTADLRGVCERTRDTKRERERFADEEEREREGRENGVGGEAG